MRREEERVALHPFLFVLVVCVVLVLFFAVFGWTHVPVGTGVGALVGNGKVALCMTCLHGSVHHKVQPSTGGSKTIH